MEPGVSPKSEEMPLPGRNCATSLPASSIAILEEEPESSINKKEAEFSPPSPISIPSGDANTVTMSQVPSLPGTSRNLVHLAHMAHLVLDDHNDRPKSSPEKCEQKRDICNLLLNDSDRCHNVKVGNRRQSIDYSRRMQYSSNSRESEQSTDDWSPTYSPLYHRSTNLLTTQYASTSKLNNAHLDSLLGNRVADVNGMRFGNIKRSALYGRRARIERIKNSVESDDKYGYNNFMANIEKVENEVSEASLYRRRNAPSTSGATSKFNIELPRIVEVKPNDVLPSIVPKKSTRPRCGFCNKRLNITTIHTCRCNGMFCAQHRYSEVHGCQYDYKTEGRKILEQANPLVAASKLPKI